MEIPKPPPGSQHVSAILTPPSSATAGICLNHTMLRILSPTKSLNFYTSLFGLSLIFTNNTNPWTVYFLGHPSDTDSSPSDIFATMGTRTGLLELVHYAGDEGKPGHRPMGMDVGFGHLGFRVPDVKALLERAQGMGAEVLVWPGETDPMIPGADRELLEDKPLHANFLKINRQFGWLRDPDGNLIEIVPTVFKSDH